MKCHPSNSCVNTEMSGIDIKITNKCNANCFYCIEKGGYEPEEKDVKSLIEATNILDYKNVLVLGGEPLMCEHLEEYLKGIQGKNIYLTTNGMLLNAQNAEMLSRHLTGINISMHYYTEARNAELYSVPSDKYSFSGICEAIPIFNKNRVPVRINCNLMQGAIDSQKDIQKMVYFAEFMGADSIRFSELQNCEKRYVDATKLIGGLNSDPYCQGCEKEVHKDENITVFVKITCHRVNKRKPLVDDPLFTFASRRVIYPNGETKKAWANSSGSDSCHGRSGCW